MAPAMSAAVEFVQSRADLMPGFVLKLTIVDSKCNGGEACGAFCVVSGYV